FITFFVATWASTCFGNQQNCRYTQTTTSNRYNSIHIDQGAMHTFSQDAYIDQDHISTIALSICTCS
uniref:Uncharacterized protein n=1 Tax=Oryza brachyantha TaxID=4533 RepID=J3M331_ORYBR